MDLKKAMSQLNFDTRMIDWNLKKGIITEEDLKNYQKGLADLSSMAAPVTLEGEIEGEDDLDFDLEENSNH